MTELPDDPGERPQDDAEERVRPCLECGTILPFDAESCSLCGVRFASGEGEEEAVKPCVACEALISEEDIFCPECGDFALYVSSEDRSKDVAALGSQAGATATLLARILSVLVVVAALAVLVAVALEAWKTRDLGGSF
ncbi:MAG: zinc ribbon domain-containing protein [Planctomycetota bacterium]